MGGEIIKRTLELLEKSGKQDKELCDYIGVAQSTFVNWKNRGTDPKSEYLHDISRFFDVSLDYLMTGEEKEWQPTITEKDKKDIKYVLEAVKGLLVAEQGIMYDGEPMDKESKENVLAAIEVAERTAILEAKRRFTPDKYKK